MTGWPANPRFKVHFTPTHASWMNLVEVWFGLVERQAVRRGVFKSVKDLNGKLRAYIEGWNKRAHPFIWTKTADDDPQEGQPSNNFKSAPLVRRSARPWIQPRSESTS